MLKKLSLIVLIVFYLAAGVNHFVHPDGYIKIIPSYLPFPLVLNMAAGASEILLAILMRPSYTRRLSGWLIVLMLAAFLPVHITMLKESPLKLGHLTVTPLIAWIRLLLQPVLMYWAWWTSRVNIDNRHKAYNNAI